MDFFSFFKKETIIEDLKSTTKEEVFSEILEYLTKLKFIQRDHKSHILKKLIERENLGSTAIGKNFALPHVKAKNIKEVIICLARSRKGVNFSSLDGEPVNIFFFLLVPEKEFGLHLKLLASCARFLQDRYFRKMILNAKSKDEIYEIILKKSKSQST